MITYQIENNISPEEFRDLLIKSTLGERRPIDDLERIKAMVENANLIITARDDLKLVGVARSITDFVYCSYLSDLAVDDEYQKQGIGKELIRLTKKETPENGPRTLTIHYPFDRYYMEESKAYDAELTYIQSQQDTSKITYALVSIKNGDAVLKDVMISGTSIKEIVKSNQKRNTE